MTLYYRVTFDDFELDINIQTHKTKTMAELIKRELNRAVTNYLYYEITKYYEEYEIEDMFDVDFDNQEFSYIMKQVVKKYRLNNNQKYKARNIKRLPACEGCRINAPGQNAHMDIGGCLYLD